MFPLVRVDGHQLMLGPRSLFILVLEGDILAVLMMGDRLLDCVEVERLVARVLALGPRAIVQHVVRIPTVLQLLVSLRQTFFHGGVFSFG